MANSFLDLREMRPEPLRCEVHFGLALAVWLRVNEKPPLVPSERQNLSCAEIHRQPALALVPPKIPAHCGQITEQRHHNTVTTLGVRR